MSKKNSLIMFISICYGVLRWQNARLHHREQETKSIQIKQYAYNKKQQYQKPRKHLLLKIKSQFKTDVKKLLTPVAEQTLSEYPAIKKWCAYHVFLVKIYCKRRTSPKKLDISRYRFLEKILTGRTTSFTDESDADADLHTISLSSSPIPDGASENSIQSVMSWVDVTNE